jgi:hypothetical protein
VPTSDGHPQQLADPNPADNATQPHIGKQQPWSTKYKNTEKSEKERR